MSNQQLAITRVANACVLIELNGHTVLTDPWFTDRWYLRRGEPLGMRVADLPPVSAIVATNFAVNHWDLRALSAYPYKDSACVYVSTERMARQARARGYRRVEVLRWNDTREPMPSLRVEAVPAGRMLRWRHNAYVLSSGATRIFFGGEIRDVALLRRYAAEHPPVDVALLPTNGLKPLLGPPLVMGPAEAVSGATALGATVLVPVHDAHARDPLSLFFRRHGAARDVAALAPPRLRVELLEPGQRWVHGSVPLP